MNNTLKNGAIVCALSLLSSSAFAGYGNSSYYSKKSIPFKYDYAEGYLGTGIVENLSEHPVSYGLDTSFMLNENLIMGASFDVDSSSKGGTKTSWNNLNIKAKYRTPIGYNADFIVGGQVGYGIAQFKVPYAALELDDMTIGGNIGIKYAPLSQTELDATLGLNTFGGEFSKELQLSVTQYIGDNFGMGVRFNYQSAFTIEGVGFEGYVRFAF